MAPRGPAVHGRVFPTARSCTQDACREQRRVVIRVPLLTPRTQFQARFTIQFTIVAIGCPSTATASGIGSIVERDIVGTVHVHEPRVRGSPDRPVHTE